MPFGSYAHGMTALPHRRRNALTGDWVLVSPHRLSRPWQGERSTAAAPARPSHGPSCYLCPGNTRANGVTNPDYDGVWSFPNDFPALLPESGETSAGDPLFESAAAAGEAQVVCYSPDHSASLATMDDAARRRVVDEWAQLSADLGARWAHVQLFENRGAMMGASSPHPHGQVWAGDFVPDIVAREDACQAEHARRNLQPLLADLIVAEERAGERVVAANAHWLVVVPFWAAWPFEMLIVSKDDVARLEDVSEAARDALARILGIVLQACDRLFDTPFPYSMGWHCAPHGLRDSISHWRLHAHIFPPLLRSADVRKHMVGFELLGEVQRDLTPEAAAERLRAVVA